MRNKIFKILFVAMLAIALCGAGCDPEPARDADDVKPQPTPVVKKDQPTPTFQVDEESETSKEGK